MLYPSLSALFVLIILHGVDGREIDINKNEITSLQCKLPETENRLYAPGVNAIVHMTDGRHVSVRETCSEIRELLEPIK